MSDIDLNKLKVVELKAELQQRGLDTKGNKPVLIDRLREALDKEAQQQQAGEAQEEGSNGSIEAGDDAFAEEEEELDEEAEEAMLAEDQGPEVQEPEPQPEPEPAAAPAAPVQPAPAQSPPKALVQSPAKAPMESPAKAPVESPAKAPVESSPKAPVVSPAKAPVETPPKAPVETPSKAPMESPTKAPVESPPKAPVVQSPSKAPVQSSPKAPLQSPPKAPVVQQQSSPVKTPLQSPQKPVEMTSPVKQEPSPAIKVDQSEAGKTSSVEKVAENLPAQVKSEPMETEAKQTNEKDEKSDVKKEEERGKKRPHSPETIKEEKVPQEDEPEFDEKACYLSWYDSDLNLVIDRSDYTKAEPMTKDGFAYCWAGARASYGLKQGKAFFEVMIDKYIDASLPESESNPHVLRVGWSVPSASMQLGEEELTYGYGGTGKISTNCKFSDYGKTFEEGSVVGAFLDMSGENVSISYTLNGEELGVAFTVAKSDLKGQPLFPHMLTKNCSFSCNFGQDEPWFPPADTSFTQIGKLTVDEQVVLGAQRPASKEDCEVIMMVGLSGCGKTTWAQKHATENPQKCYNILGTNNLIDKMKVMGLPRRRNYAGRWDELIKSCTPCFNKLLSLAATRRRNYILDQTNVYASARQRKMQQFKGFKRVAIVMVPSEEEFKKRVEKRENDEGKDVPDSATMEMKANFVLPTKGDVFEDVQFVELAEEEATKLVEQYVKEANAAGYFKKDGAKHPRYEQKQNYSGGYRSSSSSNTNSRYHSGNSNSRYGSGTGDYRNQRYGNQGGAAASGGGGGGGGYMRRDNRDGYRGGGGGGFRGASGGGQWRGGRDNRDNRDNRGYGGGGGRPDYNRRGGGGGDYRRDNKDYSSGRERGNRSGGDRDRRNDRYGGGWSGGSSYNNSGSYGSGSGYGSYSGQQQRGYNQSQQYGGYSSYSSYPSQQQSYSQTGQQSYGSYSNQQQQPQQQQTYSGTGASTGGWQQYGSYGSQSSQNSQTGYQQGYGSYQQNQSSGNYSTAQK